MNQLLLFVMFLSALVAAPGCVTAQASSAVTAVSTPLATLAAFEPRPQRPRPLVAIIGENRYTELTDYVVPYGVLTEADVADVVAVATRSGPVQTFPSTIRIQPQATVAEFDERFPRGADYVVVPAVHYVKDEALLGWIRAQAEKGATIVGVCDGVWVVAHAGLLKGRNAVGHWYSFSDLVSEFPATRWLPDRRYVGDDKVITTTGVTASIPVSLALVEAIAGTGKAQAVADKLGVSDWGPDHDSSRFQLKAGHVFTAAGNWMAFWKHEDIGIPVRDGVDEIALALAADTYARTFRTNVLTVGDAAGVRSRRGLLILPDLTPADAAVKQFSRQLPLLPETPPVAILDQVLRDIEQVHGRDTAEFVALQLEYALP